MRFFGRTTGAAACHALITSWNSFTLCVANGRDGWGCEGWARALCCVFVFHRICLLRSHYVGKCSSSQFHMHTHDNGQSKTSKWDFLFISCWAPICVLCCCCHWRQAKRRVGKRFEIFHWIWFFFGCVLELKIKKSSKNSKYFLGEPFSHIKEKRRRRGLGRKGCEWLNWVRKRETCSDFNQLYFFLHPSISSFLYLHLYSIVQCVLWVEKSFSSILSTSEKGTKRFSIFHIRSFNFTHSRWECSIFPILPESSSRLHSLRNV